MKSFEYVKAGTVKEACSLLSKHKGEAKLLAGGTEAIVRMKQRIDTPAYLVDLKGVAGLDGITENRAGGLTLGSLTTLKGIETSPVVRRKFGMLAEAASKVGSVQLRSRGTIGGNICLDSRCPYFNQSYRWKKSFATCYKAGGDVCHVAKGGKVCFAVCSADTVPALIALGAQLTVAGPQGEKAMPLEDFYRKGGDGRNINTLEAGEVVTRVEVPPLPAGAAGAYLKLSWRKAVDFPIVGVAAVIGLGKGKACQHARIVIGGVSPTPTRAVEAEAILQGKKLDEGLVGEASQLALKSVRHLSNTWDLAWYRRRVVPVMVGRAIQQAMKAAGAI
ncbi:MAG: xanthine dehydrogenase family protein subunit M [Chloroflexi bacterium]|nr:xanthine dehydrogenase family protein subunit M [Chloroflexota bacterium]